MNAHVKSVLVGAISLVVVLISAVCQAQPSRAGGPWYVAPGGEDGNSCVSSAQPCGSINGVLAHAGFAAGDTVLVAAGVYTGTGNRVVTVDKSVVLSGGWKGDFTTQNGASILDGEGARQVMWVSPETQAVLERFIVRNGRDLYYGAGIANSGSLTITASSIINNTGGDPCCSGGGGGGGIGNVGTLVLRDSTVSGNALLGGFDGGGIHNGGVNVITITNSTISNNANGQGIYNEHGRVFLSNSTVYGNGRWGISTYSGQIIVQNSILAGNLTDCYNFSGAINSWGYNVIGTQTGCSLLVTDRTGVDTQLGPLQDNGGPTWSHSFSPDSPAFNGGNPSGCTDDRGAALTVDQRGLARAGRCDVGAVELQPLEPSIKLVSSSRVAVGHVVTYAIAVRNVGATPLEDIVVSDTLPVSLTYQAGSLAATAGSCGYSSGTITWTGTVNAGTSATITFGMTADAATPGFRPITNTAIISGGNLAWVRSIAVTPFYGTYLPTVARNYCDATPFYADDFSNASSGWPINDNGKVSWSYDSGEYRIWVRNPDWWATARPGVSFTDYQIVVDARVALDTNASYGLMFGQSADGNQFYTFEVFTDATFGVYRYNSGTWTLLANGASNKIYPGLGWNHLKVRRIGAQIEVYANGQLLATMSDATFTGQRYVGLTASSYNQYNTDAHFDNFKVLPPWCDEPVIPPPSPARSTSMRLNSGPQPDLADGRR